MTRYLIYLNQARKELHVKHPWLTQEYTFPVGASVPVKEEDAIPLLERNPKSFKDVTKDPGAKKPADPWSEKADKKEPSAPADKPLEELTRIELAALIKERFGVKIAGSPNAYRKAFLIEKYMALEDGSEGEGEGE